MKRKWGLAMLALLVAVVFVSGCARKTVLKEEGAGAKESATVGQQAGDVKPVGEVKSAEEAKPAEKAEAKTKAIVTEKIEATATPAKDLYKFTDIHFDFDKFNLREGDRAILKKHADILNENMGLTIIVEGHCDETGTAEYNLALGERRANAATRFLLDLGIDAKRIKTVSYGKELPLDPGHNEEAWAKNRRAHFDASAKK